MKHSTGLTYGRRQDGTPNAIFDGLNRVVATFPELHTTSTGSQDIRPGSPTTAETMEANARLFAHAPELYAACQAILDNWENGDLAAAAQLCAAAVRKAGNKTSDRIRVRACSIVCDQNPEWGTWGVMEDCGEWFVISNASGSRILYKSEADRYWSIVTH